MDEQVVRRASAGRAVLVLEQQLRDVRAELNTAETKATFLAEDIARLKVARDDISAAIAKLTDG